MKAKERTRFDIDAARRLAGEKVFARGEAYHRDGQVELLAIKQGRVLAQVTGTEDYRTELVGRGEDIAGACSCPAFEDWGFCKHMVAAALAANAAGGNAETDSAGALSRIREHLKHKGLDALVELVVDLAEQDPALFRRLDMAAAVVGADDNAIEARLRKAIDGATRTRGFVDYHQAAGWAAEVDAVLDAVAGLASAGHAALALQLVERTIDRIEQAVGEIDDSDGRCDTLLLRARDIHLAAARVARPEPVRLARELFAREMDGDYGIFDGAAALYAEVLGERGLAECRRLAAEAWTKLPARTGRAQERSGPAGGYLRLTRILDFFAERDGDVDARIALRAKDLSSPWSYLQLAEFCLSQGREKEALRRAEEGMWMFEDDRPDQRLVFFTMGLLSRAGRNAEAEALLQRAFERAPSIELYVELCRFGGEAARERAIGLLEAQFAKDMPARRRPADLLIRILTHHAAFDAAWMAARKYGASAAVKEGLARASEATHPRQAVETYAERVDLLANAGGDPAYREAVNLVARMAALQIPAEQATYVTSLKARFGRKRNFMKLLG